ncbi:hypothetical protein V3C99_004561, partial [Haemonchus contortus]
VKTSSSEETAAFCQDREAPLDWAHAHKNWTILQWRKVIWSDKSKFLVFETGGKVCAAFCRYQIPPNYQLSTMKGGGGGGSGMVYWASRPDGG